MSYWQISAAIETLFLQGTPGIPTLAPNHWVCLERDLYMQFKYVAQISLPNIRGRYVRSMAFFFPSQGDSRSHGPGMRRLKHVLAFFWFFGVIASEQAFAQRAGATLILGHGWQVQCSKEIPQSGAVLSTAAYQPHGWYPTSVPATVFDVLVRNKIYPDPGFGMNLREVPGYPHDLSFTRVRGEDPLRPTQTWVEHWLFHAPNHDQQVTMPPDSPFKAPWWYRTEFYALPSYRGKRVWLHLDGMNYRSDIWLNGQLVAGKNAVVGAFRTFEFDVTRMVHGGENNVLAIEVFPPQLDDLAINWVDVSPTPPDDNMGLWHPVYITESDVVSVRFLQVQTHLNLPALDRASLNVSAELHNASEDLVKGTLSGRIENIHFSQHVELKPGESKRVTFEPERYPQLTLQHPRLWWPWQMGEQNLYKAELQFESGGIISDGTETAFGVREVTSELTSEGNRLFMVNGRKILIRGGGWWPDILLRSSKENQEAQIRYARGMNLNTIRMDGKFEDENFLDLADKYGMLLMPGWACCDHWEKWQDWKEEDYSVAAESLRSVIRIFRNHPSMLAWLNGDDNPPPEKVARAYVNVLHEESWPNPILASATSKPAPVTGDTGVKMLGPYDYVPPSYWLLDDKLGGAFGFNTETSMGGAVPPLESLMSFIPADYLWPLGKYWDFHAGGGKAFVKDLQANTDAIAARYGVAKSAADYALKSQVLNYDGQRAMFEAYSRNKYRATGVLHEMMNQAWPSVIWQMYDTSLRPGGSYFGARIGCEPLHIQYSYDDRSIVVLNSLYKPFRNLKVTVKVYNFDLTEQFSKVSTVDAPADSSNRIMVIPELNGLSTTYFIKLTLQQPDGKVTSQNFYWLSTKPDVYQWDKSSWFYTPTTSQADMTLLESLPKVQLKALQNSVRKGNEGHTVVTVQNPTKNLAFFVHLQITKGNSGKEALPVLWGDNYFELMPGESREVEASYPIAQLGQEKPIVHLDGWNIVEADIDDSRHPN